MVRRIAIGASMLALLYVAACAYMWATQLDHVFEPSPVLQTTPERLGMKFEELHIPVGSGSDRGELHAWWVPAEQENAPTLLYLHGNYRNISNNLEHTQRLHQLGYNVLVSDYRGYGKSSGGRPNEVKVYEDAEGAWQYLLKARGVKPQQTFIYGHSLGGAIAVDLAVHHPEAAGLITESTFTSMVEMGKLEYGYLPVDRLLDQRFDTLQKISRLKIPVLLIHGTWDKRVPPQMAQQLYAAAPQPKMLVLIEGGEHNNTGTIGWVEYRNAVRAFVKQYAH
ncbi:MAG: alpha/beta hydrolase [Nitrosomonadales bacterium]|nr:alpha/beta hydrolase [Nitrosomonadales bacterium]